MLKKITAILALATLLAYSAVNYPYPMRKNYGNGTINVKNSSADADLKAKWQNYLKEFYVENGSQARIKFYDPDKSGDENYTVSEGIGYAMLMAVYFSDATTSYQSQFDKLWAYYKAHTNGNGFMHWKINGFGNADQQNGATDGDLDVALALLMAYYQFGDTKYDNDARDLAALIRQHEVSSDGLLKPGDAWDTDRNPSYVAPAAFELFKSYNSNWDAVKDKNYSFLRTNQNGTSGLPSDWADNNGNPKQCSSCGYSGTNYGQDAVRAPWRWATANAWFGHSDANSLITTLGRWVNNQTPAQVKGPISLTGTMGSNSNASYIGSLMCGLTNNSSYQSKLNSFFSTMMGQTDRANSSYYNQSMLLLTGLLVSGNMPNLKACKAGNCGTDMPVTGGGDGSFTLLDRLSVAGQDTEDNRNLSAIWEGWYAYTDKDADDGKGGKANSSITNATFTSKDENKNCAEATSYRVVLLDGNDWAVKISSYTLNGGTYLYEPFVALGLDARKNGTAYNISSCTGGFSYQYKGPPHKFKALSSELTEGKGFDHFKNITAASANNGTGWTTATIPPDEFEQPTGEWVTEIKPFSLAKVRAWAWEILGTAKDGTGGIAGTPTTGSFAIKDFKCLGTMTLPAYTTPKCGNSGDTPPVGSGGGGGSSSSTASSGGSSSSVGNSNSSSSSGGNNNSSSSSSSSRGNSSSSIGGSSSSSSGSNTPIISFPQHVTSNGVFAIKNGINLQVSKTANMEVFGLNGKSVRNHEFSNGSYSITLGDLPKGLYIVKVQFGDQKEILRVPVR